MWMYFYRAIDSVGDTVDLAAAKQFFTRSQPSWPDLIAASSMAAGQIGKQS